MACAVSMLRVHRVDREDRPGQVGERLQELPHCRNLVRLLIHGDLAEDRADAVRQCCDQVRRLRLPCSSRRGRSCRRWRSPAGRSAQHGPGPQPGTEHPVEHIGADQGERPAEGGLLRPGRAPRPARPGPPAGGIGGPTARSRRTTATPRSPPRSRRPAAPPAHAAARASSAGPGPGQRRSREVVAAGSRDRRRWHRRAGPEAGDVSVGTSIVPPGPACRPQARRTHHPLL